ncbi:MAG: hypothetical protein HYV77_04015 [Candidatus Wildermuthbacteria bacterium]|nr:hypothetical protein [Candidatus Wildermuthbacteria bacterium]
MANLLRSHLFLAIGVVFAVLVLFSGVVLAANPTIVSNFLNLGSTKLMVQEVVLARVTGLPSEQRVGQEEEAVFTATNVGAEVKEAILKVKLSASRPLTNTNVAEIRLAGEGDSSVIPLVLVGDALEGILRTEWNIPEEYKGEVRVGVKLLKGAPFASYTLDAWVEVSSGEQGSAPSASPIVPTSTPSPSVVDVQATEEKTFSPSSLAIHAGGTVRWMVAGQTPHSITFNNAANPAPVGGADLLRAGEAHIETFAVPAGRYAYVCIFHQGMAGEVIVQ